MSKYFNNFPKVNYYFGNEDRAVRFQKLTSYSDIIDIAADDISAYLEYEILDFERPDTLSQKLYGTPEYDWTFFLMNDRLRETGWPMSLQQLYQRAQNDYFPNYTCILDISTADSAAEWADKYPVGQSVLVGGKEGIVVRKNIDVGEIVVSSDENITTSTILTYDDASNQVALTNTVYEYEGTHHYENSNGDWTDLYFPTDTPVPVTNLEFLVAENDSSKRIRIIKKKYIDQIVGEFNRQVANT